MPLYTARCGNGFDIVGFAIAQFRCQCGFGGNGGRQDSRSQKRIDQRAFARAESAHYRHDQFGMFDLALDVGQTVVRYFQRGDDVFDFFDVFQKILFCLHA